MYLQCKCFSIPCNDLDLFYRIYVIHIRTRCDCWCSIILLVEVNEACSNKKMFLFCLYDKAKLRMIDFFTDGSIIAHFCIVTFMQLAKSVIEANHKVRKDKVPTSSFNIFFWLILSDFW